MKAFNGSEDFKNELLALDKEHQRLDMYVKQSYGVREYKEFKGCSVGCLIYSLSDTESTSNHAFLAERLGVPEFIVHLQDSIFEGLEDSSKWTEDLLSAIPVGADLDPVLPKFLKFLVEMNPSDEAYYQMTVDVLENWIRTGIADTEAAEIATSTAMASAWEAARAADAASSESSARASRAARTATNAAMAAMEEECPADAARSTSAAAWEAARSDVMAEWGKIAAEFLRLIKECKQ